MIQGYEKEQKSQDMAWKMVQYLHFRILDFPVIRDATWYN